MLLPSATVEVLVVCCDAILPIQILPIHILPIHILPMHILQGYVCSSMCWVGDTRVLHLYVLPSSPVNSICCEAVLLTYVLGVGGVSLGLCIVYIAR